MAAEPKSNVPDDRGAKTAPPSVIHAADLASGPSGGVIRGDEIDLALAIIRRQQGQNVVGCGDDLKANRRLAEKIEAAVGPYVRSPPHKQNAGPRALPHYQQQDPDHEGHTFYETANQKALRKEP
ncbi:MAG TPA: hypothetical protein VE988_17335 [Gemmataceae bacterium]|nr:hypothetical protein [Gemmataceae bacterium]